MICEDCARAADDRKPELHPDNCGCDCQHRAPAEDKWEAT